MKAAHLACALLLLSACASRTQLKLGKSDEGEVVEAEGMAPYNAADIIGTKRASLVDAQKNAVEKAVGVFVSGRTMVEKAVAIENNILAQTDGYIKKYDIIKEWSAENFHHTKIRALVALRDLEKDLKAMSLLQVSDLNRPRVSVTLSEKIDKETVESRPASMALQQQLTESGYTVVVAGDDVPPELDIRGTVTSHPFQAEGLGGFVSYRARIAVEVVRPGTTKTVTSLTKEASGLGGNAELAGLKSLEVVGKLAGEELSQKLLESYANKRTVFVAIERVSSFAEVDRVKKHLVAQPGIKDLVLRTYDEDLAQFEVELDKNLTSEQLASRLEASQSLPLKVIEAKPQTIRLSTQK